MINVCLLGATGSIGCQTIKVIERLGNYKIVAMSCNTKTKELKELLTPSVLDICIGSVADKDLFNNVNVHFGEEGLVELVKNKHVDVVINALSGSSGLIATIEAIKHKKKVLLANKESLVLAGDLISKLVKKYKTVLYPIDSEHSAIWQCLNNVNPNNVEKLIITASGGAFRDLSRDELKNVTINDALNHPTWKMGGKITVDCATMVNKALEVIEAHYLFGYDYSMIDAVLHKESKIHGGVKMIDGSFIMQLAPTSMLIPIQYALTYPDRFTCPVEEELKLDSLNFKAMDDERYPMFSLGVKMGMIGGIMPCVYSTANEVAVNKFLNGKISFLEIENIINKCCNDYLNKNIQDPTLDDILTTIKDIKLNY